MTTQQPGQNTIQPQTAPKKNVPAMICGTIGGVLMMINGIQMMRGYGSNLVMVLGSVFMLIGMGLRGQLSQKL